MNPAIATALIALGAYRLWRFLAVDTFPPVKAVRVRVIRRPWAAEFLTCPWCAGCWVTAAVTWATWAVVGFAAPGLVGLAAATIVGVLAQHDEGTL